MTGALAIHHVALDVCDWDATRHFYGNLLGLPLGQPVTLGDGTVLAYAALSDGSKLEFVIDRRTESSEAHQGGLRHVALRVSALKELRNHLVDKAVPLVMDITDLPELDMKVILCKDPNGVTIELVEVRAEERDA